MPGFEPLMLAHTCYPSLPVGREALDLQTLILSLERYWAEQGCVVQQPFDGEVGAGTMHP